MFNTRETVVNTIWHLPSIFQHHRVHLPRLRVVVLLLLVTESWQMGHQDGPLWKRFLNLIEL